jgi:hypothetical protein
MNPPTVSSEREAPRLDFPTRRAPDAQTPRRQSRGASEKNRVLGALDFFETGGLAAQSTQVEELGAANACRTNLLNLVDDLGV